MFPFYFLAFAGWLAACAVKAATALRRGSPYVFAWWDGGAISLGKALTRRGSALKLVVSALAFAACIAWELSPLPSAYARLLILVVCVAEIVCDFGFRERVPSTPPAPGT